MLVWYLNTKTVTMVLAGNDNTSDKAEHQLNPGITSLLIPCGSSHAELDTHAYFQGSQAPYPPAQRSEQSVAPNNDSG
jgi:hypothetical protein